jgi:flagellar basal body rod protein FlgC
MDILGIAQQGLQQAEVQFNRTAQGIAQTSLTTGPPQPPADSVNLSDVAVSLLSATSQYEAVVGVAHTVTEMQQETMSLLA